MRLPAWPTRPAIDWRGSRWVVLALVALGHLMLLAWWRDRPAPIPHDAFPVLQGQLLSVEIPHAPTLQAERSRPPTAQLPPTHSMPHSTEPAQQRMPAAPAGADARVVMTGCIDRADQLVPAGASTIGTTVDSLDFVMTHAELANSPHTVSPEPTGTSGTAAPGYNGIGAIYRLDGPLTTLNPHVGHRVEITGTREAGAPGAKPPKGLFAMVPPFRPSVATACDRRLIIGVRPQ